MHVYFSNISNSLTCFLYTRFLNDTKNYIALSYFNGVSDSISRQLSKFGYNSFFTVLIKLECFIKTGKDGLNIEKMTHVVYKIDCKDCNLSYMDRLDKATLPERCITERT